VVPSPMGPLQAPHLPRRWRGCNRTTAGRSGLAIPPAEPVEPEVITRRFIDDNRELFLLQEPASELQLASAVPDDRGGTVLRFTQTWQGFEVWPGQITANVAADGR